MNATLLYLDASAIVKLAVPEPESRALFELLENWPERVSSALAQVEVLRALRRSGAPASAYRRGEQVLARLALIRLHDSILAEAASLEPPNLRALDAIHMATALSLRGDLAAFVTYDRRLAEAAAAARLKVWAPGTS